MAAALRIQSDWSRALRRDEGEAWLSCRSPGKPTLYGSLTRRGLSTEGVPDIAASEGFVVGEVTKKSILVSCPHENASTKFLAPFATFPRIHRKSVTCLDISSGGGLGVSASTDGTMKIWQAANGEMRRLLEGHVYDVNCCRFFPSGLVVLSGGMDAQLKVWSAEDASCVVTFKGHRGGILDTAIVDRGRNVLSCSRDGTARLWDCGKSACLAVVADCGSPVNGIAVGAADNSVNLGAPEKTPSEREIGTEGKILLLAREDKKLQGVGLQSRQPHRPRPCEKGMASANLVLLLRACLETNLSPGGVCLPLCGAFVLRRGPRSLHRLHQLRSLGRTGAGAHFSRASWSRALGLLIRLGACQFVP
ncbi:proteasomal ATPase-associated factor 1 isoform X3 [Cygnus atratus]|uniref:proteasomal ATPase-associated factor 1 isoform X3 n=1 Tax=Cygnus atratus TaxID=8868 RepID=UPI0015D5F0A4|nr:proteasomal ATPase-associated factor 1 isoform X3 [Cygnus atratus]